MTTEVPGTEHGYENAREGATERRAVCDQVRAECADHRAVIETQVLDVPQAAIQYLAENVTAPELLPIAIQNVQELLSHDPRALDDPEFATLELDICLNDVHVASEIESRAAGHELADEKHSTIAIIEAIETQSAHLTGCERLQFATEYLDGPEVPLPVRKTLSFRFAAIQAALDRMLASVEDPDERVAFEALLISAPIDLSASTITGSFEPLWSQIATSDDISVETKQKIHATIWKRTGAQLDQTLDQRDENGNPIFGEGAGVPVGEGVTAYVRNDGSRALRISVSGRGDREIPWQRGMGGNVISTKISLGKIWQVNEWSGQTDFFGEGINIETQVFSQTDPQKLTKVRNTINALLGGVRGFDGLIITDADAQFIGWFNQFIATKGDAAQGDVDKEFAADNRTNLGIHPNGDHEKIDYDVLTAAAGFAKEQYASGAPDYFALQSHLHDLFPGRVPYVDARQS